MKQGPLKKRLHSKSVVSILATLNVISWDLNKCRISEHVTARSLSHRGSEVVVPGFATRCCTHVVPPHMKAGHFDDAAFICFVPSRWHTSLFLEHNSKCSTETFASFTRKQFHRLLKKFLTLHSLYAAHVKTLDWRLIQFAIMLTTFVAL
jgi:hypothetical protein